MAKQSAGILLYRRAADTLEVLLVHPGGPFFVRKDAGVWTIPKGEAAPGEDLLHAARREFEEETGFTASGPFIELSPVRLASGKIVHAWAAEGDCDPAGLRSCTFTLEWPPRSGQRSEFPEVDRGAFFTLGDALSRIHPAQAPLLRELEEKVARGDDS